MKRSIDNLAPRSPSHSDTESADAAKETPVLTGNTGGLDNAPPPPVPQGPRPRQQVDLPDVATSPTREEREAETQRLHDEMVAAQAAVRQQSGTGPLLTMWPLSVWTQVADDMDWKTLLKFRLLSKEANDIVLMSRKSGLVVTGSRRAHLQTAVDSLDKGTPLKHITLRGPEFTDADLLLLPSTLQSLWLDGTTNITANGLRNLAAHAPGLRALDIHECGFGTPQSRAMLDFPGLELLILDSGNSADKINDQDLLRIPIAVRELLLINADVTPDGLKQLGERLSNMRTFGALGCRLGPEHRREIRAFANETTVTVLDR